MKIKENMRKGRGRDTYLHEMENRRKMNKNETSMIKMHLRIS